MDEDLILARMNAALEQAVRLRAEALRVHRRADAHVVALRQASAGLREVMEHSLALRSWQRRARR